MKTTYPNPKTLPRRWHLVDARNQVLGRVAARLARVLMGKHRPTYVPHIDTGEFVVVIHASALKLTGTKRSTRKVRYHTHYLGGLKETPVARLMENKPEEVLRLAVRRMLPKNKLAREMLKKLKIYRGADHPHSAQQPQALDLATV